MIFYVAIISRLRPIIFSHFLRYKHERCIVPVIDHTFNRNTMAKRTASKRKKPVAISYEEPVDENQDSVYFGHKDSKWEPVNWKEILKNIRTMRSGFDAPVDGMGCEQCVDKDEPPEVRSSFYKFINLYILFK